MPNRNVVALALAAALLPAVAQAGSAGPLAPYIAHISLAVLLAIVVLLMALLRCCNNKRQ